MKLRLVASSVVMSVIVLFAISALAQQQSADEQAVWKLEHSYWEYVKAADLGRYRSLWHANFVGWPMSSAAPVRKDHITDWITSAAAKGLHVKSFTLRPAGGQTTENMVVTHYWLTADWVDKSGQSKPETTRITHTWIRTANGWQIIGGMSAPMTIPAPK